MRKNTMNHKRQLSKKMITVGVSMMMTVGALAGCGADMKTMPNTAVLQTEEETAGETMQSKSVGMVNASMDEQQLYTVSGSKVASDDENLVLLPYEGVGLRIPDSWNEQSLYLLDSVVDDSFCFSVVRPSLINKVMSMSEEELEQSDLMEEVANGGGIGLLKLTWVDKSVTEEALMKENSGEYDSIKKLASTDKQICYAVYSSADAVKGREGWTDDDIKMFRQVQGEINQLEDFVVLFPATEEEELSVEDIHFSDFEAETVDGKKVNGDLFKDYELTMVNIWITTCGPCVEEMPDLANMYHKLPDGVNMVSVCLDGNDDREAMEKILEKSGVEFDTIVGNDDLKNNVLKDVIAFPTTLFIDSEGNVVGRQIEGALSVEAYLEEINSRLE